MSSHQHLLTTAQAAHHVGVTEPGFHTWASRRGLRAVRKIRLGRATVCVWDANEVFAATKVAPASWRTKEKHDG